MRSLFLFKILFIGDKEVGRSSFLKDSLRTDYFNGERKNTIGVEIYRKELTIEGRVVDLMIHDVSNKEIWRPLLRSYISGSNAAILMFDLTNLKSFNYLFHFPKMIREVAGEIPILLLGNKIDLEEERAVSREEGTAFTRDNNLLGYIEISAKTGQDCEGIFKLIAENIMTQLQLH